MKQYFFFLKYKPENIHHFKSIFDLQVIPEEHDLGLAVVTESADDTCTEKMNIAMSSETITVTARNTEVIELPIWRAEGDEHYYFNLHRVVQILSEDRLYAIRRNFNKAFSSTGYSIANVDGYNRIVWRVVYSDEELSEIFKRFDEPSDSVAPTPEGHPA